MNSPENDVFQRTELNDFYIVNPPFAKNPKGQFEKPLKTHITFLINLAQKNNQPIVLVVPVRRTTCLFRRVESSSFMCFVFFSTRFFFLQGVNLIPRGVAPNDTVC